MEFTRRTTTPSTILPLRLARSIWRQSRLTPTCPEAPRLDGKLAVVTGGNAGIGREICRGLARRGAEVIVAARTRATAQTACLSIERETGATLHHVLVDLADLESVTAAVDALQAVTRGRAIDIVVNNAGIWPRQYATSAQGHEIAFAVNTLAHHVLIRRLLARGLVAAGRVVVLTGDIYVRARECTPEFKYEGAGGGAMAYSRSKLGNMWFAAELQRRHPELEVHVAHPGVVASNLGGEVTGFARTIRDMMMIGVEAGAQTPLICATQPNLARGGYYHNTMGHVILPESDPAADMQKAAALWERMEALSPGIG
jgi:NAD(P)-dependent dehydrogenase (short-subunit alcohol dehydrogenase family)